MNRRCRLGKRQRQYRMRGGTGMPDSNGWR
jgi:hypothetical protein